MAMCRGSFVGSRITEATIPRLLSVFHQPGTFSSIRHCDTEIR